MPVHDATALNKVYEKIWELSPYHSQPDVYEKLQELTAGLIKSYTAAGRLDEDPFLATEKRILSLPHDQVNTLLKSATCLVTGGLGCVGSCLVSQLATFEVSKIIVLDKVLPAKEIREQNNKILYIQADICDEENIYALFNEYQPDFVFHTAAQRDPGYAELHVAETVDTNIFGTLNIVKACENTPSIQQCVFSSTGKASRYYTDELYAATKKIDEYIFDAYSRNGKVRYSFVRFTHILDNSLMNMELKEQSKGAYIAIHSPGKYVTAQNVSEAASLLLNALLNSRLNECNFLIVRHLEWPVESLELALYYIKECGRALPVIFKGNPPGYCEKFFRGQMDWSAPEELNLLINVYENKYKTYNEKGDIIISKSIPVNRLLLDHALADLKSAPNESMTREYLAAGLKSIMQDMLQHADQRDTLNILQWGLHPQHLAAEGTSMDDYGPTVNLLLESLACSGIQENQLRSTIYGE